jgi:hypothetical protein
MHSGCHLAVKFRGARKHPIRAAGAQSLRAPQGDTTDSHRPLQRLLAGPLRRYRCGSKWMLR